MSRSERQQNGPSLEECKSFCYAGLRSPSLNISLYMVDICTGFTLFTIHPELVNFPLFNFMFQLVDDSNFILFLLPLRLAFFWLLLPRHIFLLLSSGPPPHLSPQDWLLLSLRITRELRESYEMEESATVKQTRGWLRFLDHLRSLSLKVDCTVQYVWSQYSSVWVIFRLVIAVPRHQHWLQLHNTFVFWGNVHTNTPHGVIVCGGAH